MDKKNSDLSEKSAPSSSSRVLEELLAVSDARRDEAWEEAVFKELPKAEVKVMVPEAQSGPDGWPYLFVNTGTDADDTAANVLSWLAARGIGLALNANKPVPDAVLTWGMIWNFKERGELVTAAEKRSSGSFEIQPGQEVLAGPPSEAYLPKYVRSIIKQFLLDQGVYAPKVLMISLDKTNYDLCFSIESLKSPPVHEHANIAEALSWFLPLHYSVGLVSEKTVAGFQPL
jgi:hypothetical protein